MDSRIRGENSRKRIGVVSGKRFGSTSSVEFKDVVLA